MGWTPVAILSVVWNDHVVSNIESRDSITNLRHTTDSFMSKTPWHIRRTTEAVIEVKVGTTNGGAGDANHDVCLVDDGWQRHVYN